jgi:hypothetical protein
MIKKVVILMIKEMILLNFLLLSSPNILETVLSILLIKNKIMILIIISKTLISIIISI